MDTARLISLLRCPVCGADLELATARKVDWVRCRGESCSWKQRLSAEKPLCFLEHETAIDPGFDRRWQQHPRPQATTAGVLEQKTGLAPAAFADKLVLDAGCGCGRFSGVASGWGAEVVGVDASPAGLAASQENAPGAGLVQASLLALPFRDATFDLAFSVGVLHHTPDPRAAFAEVTRTVRSGGSLAVWVYACQLLDRRLEPLARMLHDLTRAVPPADLLAICQQHAVPVRDAYREIGRWDDLQRVLQVSMSPDDEECISDTFDWHAPRHRSWHSAEELRSWFEEEGFTVDWTGAFPVSMRGVRR